MKRKGGRGDVAGVNELLVRAKRVRTTAELRSLARGVAREMKTQDARALVLLALELARRGQRFLAYELFEARRKCIEALTEAEIEQLGAGIDSWVAVDCFACFVAGPAWRVGCVRDKTIQRWARSKDRWWRRAALAATVPLNLRARGGTGDARRTLAVCERLVPDRDDLVVKALSWALRSLIVHDRRAVERFLEQHDGEIAARVRREVGNKLRTGLKTPRAGSNSKRRAR